MPRVEAVLGPAGEPVGEPTDEPSYERVGRVAWIPALLGAVTSSVLALSLRPAWYVHLLLAIALGVAYWKIAQLMSRPGSQDAAGSRGARHVQVPGPWSWRRLAPQLDLGSTLLVLVFLAAVLNLLAVWLAGMASFDAVGVVVSVLIVAGLSRQAKPLAFQAMLTHLVAFTSGTAVAIAGQSFVAAATGGAEPAGEVVAGVQRQSQRVAVNPLGLAPADEVLGGDSGEFAPKAVPDYEQLDLTGHWQGDYGNCYVHFDGREFRAVFDFQDGRIVGNIDGDVIRGWWTVAPGRGQEPNTDGFVEFTVTDEGGRLKLDGRWSYGTEEPVKENWDLRKVDGFIAPEIEDLFKDEDSFIRAPALVTPRSP